MYSARIRNAAGDELTLTGRENEYQIIRVAGLNPPEAQINTAAIVTLDGARYNSARLETREIVITIRINGDAEANRIRLYHYFRTKDKVTFFYKNGALDVSIDGYVQAFSVDLFAAGETAQIVILCPFPYFAAMDEIIEDSARTIAAFTFPFSINIGEPVVISSLDSSGGTIYINNTSDTDAGFTLTIDVLRACSSIFVKNLTTGDTLTLSGTFLAGDTVRVNTTRGQKSIVILRDGQYINGFSTFTDDSVFWQLAAGENAIEYMVDGTPVSVSATLTFAFHLLYRGV